MCVHVLQVSGMPFSGLVWVDHQPLHTIVYADQSLAEDGRLSLEGRTLVNEALQAVDAESLDVAQKCSRPLLWSVAS